MFARYLLLIGLLAGNHKGDALAAAVAAHLPEHSAKSLT
jgi:hypothetical protein